MRFYTDPNTMAAAAAAINPSIQQIAATPQARWVGEWTPDVRADVDRYVTAATKLAQIPVVVIYAIPVRDGGSYSAGGVQTPAAYRTLVDQVAAGIRGRLCGVVLEPDALAAMDQYLTAAQQADRVAMLAYANQHLTRVYTDIGHSRWHPAAEAARRLRAVRAQGFSLNVSGFLTTEEEEAYGEQVAASTGLRYVIDTSRNGNGPPPPYPLNWCNPPGRALGVAPTTTTKGAHCDAYLWVKHPGESDGDNPAGAPPSGHWWNDYALDLLRRAQEKQA